MLAQARSTTNHNAQSFAFAGQSARYMTAELIDAGNLFYSQGNPQEAINCFLKAMELMSSSSVENDEVAICHYKTACAYTMLNMNNHALEHYRQARRISRRAASANEWTVEKDMHSKASSKDTVAHRFFKILKDL